MSTPTLKFARDMKGLDRMVVRGPYPMLHAVAIFQDIPLAQKYFFKVVGSLHEAMKKMVANQCLSAIVYC